MVAFAAKEAPLLRSLPRGCLPLGIVRTSFLRVRMLTIARPLWNSTAFFASHAHYQRFSDRN